MAYTFTRTGAQIEEIHNTVEDPKSNTQFSDDIRTIAGEYRGLWPDTGGSANKGDTYQTQVSGTGTGQYFTALQDTAVDPVGDDVNWREVVNYRNVKLNFATMDDAVVSTLISAGDYITLNERTHGNDGGGEWVVTPKSSVTVNGIDIVECSGDVSLALVLRVMCGLSTKQLGALLDGSDETALVSRGLELSADNNVDLTLDNGIAFGNLQCPRGCRVVQAGELTDLNSGKTCTQPSGYPKGKRICFVHAVYSVAELLVLKSLGFNVVLSYLQFPTQGSTDWLVNACEAVGFEVIINSQTESPNMTWDDREALIGYYLFDEPIQNGESVASQDSRINAHRLVTDKQLYITSYGFFDFHTQNLSTEFDVILADNYFNTSLGNQYGDNVDDSNRARTAGFYAEQSFKVSGTKLAPCLGMFTSAPDNYGDKDKALRYAKANTRFADNSMISMFSWDSSRSQSYVIGMLDDDDFFDLAKVINFSYLQKTHKFDFLNYFQSNGAVGISEAVQRRIHDVGFGTALPISVKNVGSQTDERNSDFAWAGYGFSSGSLVGIGMRSLGSVSTYSFYKDYSAGTGAAQNFSILSSYDDFTQNTTELTVSLSPDSGVFSSKNINKNKLIGLYFDVTTENSNRWKFISGYTITHNWTGF